MGNIFSTIVFLIYTTFCVTNTKNSGTTVLPTFDSKGQLMVYTDTIVAAHTDTVKFMIPTRLGTSAVVQFNFFVSDSAVIDTVKFYISNSVNTDTKLPIF